MIRNAKEEMKAKILERTEDFVALECGYVYFWPKRPVGAISAVELRLIADILDEKNAAWDKSVQDSLSGMHL